MWRLEFLKNGKCYIEKLGFKFEKVYSFGNTENENVTQTLTQSRRTSVDDWYYWY